MRGRLLGTVLLLVGLLVVGAAAANEGDAQFRKDLEAIVGPKDAQGLYASRAPGSDGHRRTAAYLKSEVARLIALRQAQIHEHQAAIAALQQQIQSHPGEAESLRAQIQSHVQAIAAWPEIELKTQEFSVMTPVTERAEVIVPESGHFPVYPFWPASVRVNSTPEEGIKGKLVYVGNAGLDQVRPAELMGQIAVVESSAGAYWAQASYFGARALIVLEGPRTSHVDLRGYDLAIPVNIPRFYVPAGAFADQLRAGKITGEVTLKASVHWRNSKVENLYVLVRPATAAAVSHLPAVANWVLGETIYAGPGGWAQSTNPTALAVSVPYEAAGLVPDLASGANQAVQTAGGLSVLRTVADPLHRELTEDLAALPAGVSIPAACADQVRYDAAGHRLVVTGTLSSAQQAALRGASSDPAWNAALASLLQRGEPMARPMLVTFLAADSIQFQASRQMLMAFSDVPAAWRKVLNSTDLPEPCVSEREASLKTDLARCWEIVNDPSKLDITADRSLVDRIGKIIETDNASDQDELFRIRILPDAEHAPLRDREAILEHQQIVRSTILYGIQQKPADLPRTAIPPTDPLDRTRHVVTDPEQSVLPLVREYAGRALVRMAGFGPDVQARLSPQMRELLSKRFSTGYVGLIDTWGARHRELDNRIALYQWLAARLHRDPDPDDRSNNSRLLEAVIGLDVSDGGDRVGPMFWGKGYQNTNISHVQDWQEWYRKQETDYQAGKGAWWMRSTHGLLDLEPFSGSRTPQSFLAAPIPIPTEMAPAWGVPSFSLVTLDDLRLRRDTPRDTLDNLNLPAILAQVPIARASILQAWNDPNLKGPLELKWTNRGIGGQVVSPAAGRPVPDLPREGFLATYFYCNRIGGSPLVAPYIYAAGLRRSEIVPCDAEGTYLFDGLPRLEGGQGNMLQLAVEVFRVEPDGHISACTDLGKQSGDITVGFDLRWPDQTVRSLVFNCDEFSLVGLYDPRFMQDLGDVSFLDQRRDAIPQRYNYLLTNQIMAGFVEPGQKSYLIFRYGRAGNRLLLLNGQGNTVRPDGYDTAKLRNLGPVAVRTAHDFWWLDDQRLKEYAKAGVRSELISALHDDAGQRIEAASKATDGRRLIADSLGAWANEARVYAATQDMANDVIRAAIFLLLLCMPFSFCMERLLIGTPSIYKQIAGVVGIFTVMTLALASFHPAFRISSSPLIIILAFAIIFMSIVVIGVVYSKFDAELKRIRSGRGTAASTSFARASVLMSAVLLGIANMRRRLFRTVLTSITIVLITFAVLCFTSSSQYLDTTTLPTGVARQYSGLMLRQRGFRPIPPISVSNIEAALANGPAHPEIPGYRRVVERWWNVDAADPNTRFSVVALGARAAATPGVDALPAADRIYPSQAILGLSPGESCLSPIAQVVPHFDRLEKGEWNVIYFSREVAAKLLVRATAADGKPVVRPIAEGEWVSLGGLELQVAGIYDSHDFDSRVTTLSGEPLAPVNYKPGMLDASGKSMSDSAVENLTLDAEGSANELGKAYEHLAGSDFVIVPSSVSRMMENATLRSVGIRLADQDEVVAVGNDLAKRFAVAMFAGYDDGVRMVAASNLSKVSGAGQVAIPLAIAGLIIFNTMMGSIAERRREIHVYTSLGLAPLHVGALFLAEAMTYGLIGTVFGYVIGQGVGTFLMNHGLMGGVTLNYSGTSAILTMGLILVIVLLSALVPARLASKIAAPSIERTWKVPLPEGDTIVAALPFTINKTAADGVLAYLAEYFDAHQEGSIGKFSAGKIEFVAPDAPGTPGRGLKTMVWLTPFDLGIRQHLTLRIFPGQYEDIFEVEVILKRMSGDDSSWYRMNRSFLTELRKQFLQWRSLTPQRMLEYVEASRASVVGHVASANSPLPVNT